MSQPLDTIERVFDSRYRIYNWQLDGYYHPDHAGTVDWAEAMTWDDIGEAGYARDQLAERDDGHIQPVQGVVTRLHGDEWVVTNDHH